MYLHRGNFVYDDLLKMIEDGRIALLHAPTVTREGNSGLLWTRWMLRLGSMNARDILEECLRVAAEQFSNTCEADLPLVIEKDIARDLRRMQIQPVIMDDYRRFVVLTGKADQHLTQYQDGASSI